MTSSSETGVRTSGAATDRDGGGAADGTTTILPDGDDIQGMAALNIKVGGLWIERGLSVFPIAISWDSRKGKTNKRPLTPHGFKDATTDHAALNELFYDAMTRLKGGEVLACGVVPGSGGFVVFDDDRCTGFLDDELHLPSGTYRPRTSSGNEHRWHRKRETVHVGNVSWWANQGIDVRSDAGYVVCPGTVTPWGTWTDPDQPGWGTALEVPEHVWRQMIHGSDSPTPAGETGSWRRYDPEVHERLIHPATLELLNWLVDPARGSHRVDPAMVAFHPRKEGEPYLQVTRPGKASGVSGTLGYVAPGALHVFSSNWPGISSGTHYLDALVHSRDAGSADGSSTESRHVVLHRASGIEPRPTTWTWEGRIPTGSLALIAGPEGTGKSSCAYWIAAQLTLGGLPGVHQHNPRDVLIAATEDSWSRTIVPRLIAAGADLDRVWRVEVATSQGTGGYLTLPKDVHALAASAEQTNAALLLLDPIMSRLEASLDSHKDAETRQALEPISAVADRTGMSVVGLIHFNKSGSSDVLNNVMASKAFTAVARSVSTVIRDPDDETGRTRIFGTPKSNLGRDDLPLLPFELTEHSFPNAAGEVITTSRIEWLAAREGSVGDLMRQVREPSDRSNAAEAAAWLLAYLDDHKGRALRVEVLEAGSAEGFGEELLKRARTRAKVEYRNTRSTPRRTYWMTAAGAAEWDAEAVGRQPGESD